MIGHAVNAFDNDVDALDQSVVPEWIKRRAGIEVEKRGKTHYFFVLESWLPMADLVKLAEIPREFMTSLTPFLRVPLEQYMNYSFYDERALEAFEGEQKRFMGQPLRGKAVNLLRNLRVLNEVDRLLFRPESRGVDKLLLATTGLRGYAVEEEHAQKRALSEMAMEGANLKRALARAEVQFGASSPLALELAEKHTKLKQMQRDLRQEILIDNPDAFKLTR